MQNVSPRQAGDGGSRVVAVLHAQASLAQMAGAAMAGVRLTLPSRRVLSPTPNCSARSPQVTSRDSPRFHPVPSMAAVASSALSTGSVQLLTANSRAAASPVPMRATVGTFTARSVSPQRTAAWSMSLPVGPHAPSVRAASPGSRALPHTQSVVQPVQCVMRAAVQTVQPTNAPAPRRPAVGIAFPGAALPPGASHQRIPPRRRKNRISEPTFSIDRPLLPWNAAMVPEGEQTQDAAELSEAVMDGVAAAANEAAAQQLMLGPAVALAPSSESVRAVQQEGVASIQDALSQKTCQRLRAFVLGELSKACRTVEDDPTQKYTLFSRDIRETRASKTALETRFELQLPRTNITETALMEVLHGQVGSTLVTLAGSDARLWEFTAMVAMPDAIPQRLHCDTGSPSPALFTTFVALQDVTENMGPTRLSPRVASLSPSRTSNAAPLQCPHAAHGASKAGPIIPVVRQMDMMPVKQNLGYPKAASHPCAAGPTQTSQTASGSPIASMERSRGSDKKAQQASVCSPVRCVLLDGSRRGSPMRVQEACVNSTQGSPVLLGTPKLSKHPDASSRGTPVRIVGGPPMQGACCKTELAENARAAACAAASPIIQPAGSGISDPQSETRTPSGSLQSLPVVSGSCKLIGQAAPCPDPFLSTGPSAAPLSPMARTPEPPGDGRNGSWSGLDSRQSLTSSFLGNDNSSPPQFGSAKILHTSSNKHRTLSPGAACVVLPPSPEIAPRSVGPISSDVQGPAGESHIQATLFELFRVPISEPHVAEQVGKEIARQAETLWDDLVILRPVQNLASAVARSISSSGQAKDEPLWTEHLGDEEAYQGWWKFLLARYGLSGSGDSILHAEVTDLAVAACRMLRDHFAPSKYVRNLRTVRSGAKRVHDRYDNFRHLSSSTFAKHYRCRSRLSFEDRLCSQTRKSQLACPADQLRVEVEVLRSLEHPHLPRVVESFEDFNDIYIISEIVDNVRLLHFMQTRLDMRTGISEGWLAQVFKQILETLSYCHQLKPHSLVHGDIGLETVGLASVSDAACAPHVVISGLGVAGTLPSPSLRYTLRLSGRLSRSSQPVSELIAPRSDVEELCSPKHDVWCCGCLLYLLLTGHVPGDAFFGETFRPKASSPDWALVRHASAQAEALCSRMLESDAARRPSAADCLCYPWLQSGSKFCFKMVPLSVLEKIIQIEQQNQECKEVVGDVVAELSLRSVSCASTAFATLAMPSQSWGDPLESVQLTPFLSAAPLLQLGISVPNVEKVMRAFAVPSGLIAHGSFVKRCLELAEDQLDRSLWRLFVAAREDESGVLSASQLEEVLHGDVSEASAAGGKELSWPTICFQLAWQWVRVGLPEAGCRGGKQEPRRGGRSVNLDRKLFFNL
ncbi:CPK30 [Symbiodinium sp. CCMP2456]|nr:CPK30 [Symbiodinium sp. CCMP2456]